MTEPSRILELLTAVRPPARPRGRIAEWLAAAGIRLVSTPGGWAHADCPVCGRFGMLSIDADGHRWRSACGCFGRFPLGEPEAVALFHRLASHAS